MEFTKKQFDDFRQDVKEALQGVGEKYELNLDIGSIRYGSYDFTLKITATKSGSVDGEKEKFMELCSLYGFSPEDYCAEFDLEGKTYRLIGFDPKKRKYACKLYSLLEDKQVSGTVSMVKMALGRH